MIRVALRRSVWCALALITVAAARAAAQAPAVTTADDLRRRLVAFAADSTLGRATGTRGYAKAADYLAKELARIRVKPAGVNNTFFQNVPILRVHVDLGGTHFTIGPPVELKAGVDYLPIVGHFGVSFAADMLQLNRQLLEFRGSLSEIITDELKARMPLDTGVFVGTDSAMKVGRLEVLRAPLRDDKKPAYQLWNAAPYAEQYRGAAGLLVEGLDMMPRAVREELLAPGYMLLPDVMPPEGKDKLPPAVPPVLAISKSVANVLRIAPAGLADLRLRSVVSSLSAPTRNVVAMIEGGDLIKRAEVVVISAHADHLGIAPPTGRIGADSIMNGADISGSGSVALLEIAKYIASLPQKPKRTIVFLWTVGEEQGMLGSQYFVNHAGSWLGTIVANINIDAIGRGGAADIEHGGPDYVQVIGAAQLSDEYAHWVDAFTHDAKFGLRPDDEYDLTQTHPRASCAGDHWSFVRRGIPSLFITTGDHADARSVSDAPGTIDYDKLTKVTRLVAALALGIANRDERPALDDPVLGRYAPCGQ